MLHLKKFPDIPVSTRGEARESRPQPEEPRFPLLVREVGSFPCVVGKEFPAFPSDLRGGAIHKKGERNSRVVPPFPESPRCLSPFQGNLFSLLASTFKPRIDSHRDGRLDSPVGNLVGKPRVKASRESHRSLDPRVGKRDTAATAREESARACPYSRRGLTPLGRLQKYPKIHVGTGEESSGSVTESTQGLRPQH